MEALPRLQARITSLEDLREIIRALRATAASHVQEAHGALPGIREYVEVVRAAIVRGAVLLPRSAPDAAVAGEADGVMLVLCSEHGFVGAFNERLLDLAAARRRPGQRLVVVGTRGAAVAEERGLEHVRSLAMATHAGGVLGVTRAVARLLAGVASADIVFASYRPGGSFEAATRRILPLDPALLAGDAQVANPPLHHLPPERLLEQLAEEYLFAEITHAAMESLASENGARLRAMETADHNMGDRLDELQKRARTLRQEAITAELLDVVTGAEAILSGAGSRDAG
jgi:F-type H+-transporting ATPase subunit gamma